MQDSIPSSHKENSPASDSSSHQLFSGLRIVSFCTLLSRILGLVRDMWMAALFGNGLILDAFTLAFRLPNLARRLFGEGALTAAFLPMFVREMENEGKESAWKLASAVLTSLATLLCLIVLISELLIAGFSFFTDISHENQLLLGLIAVMLPYLILICIASQISAIFHALGHFTWPALLPILMNLIWILGLGLVTFLFESDVARIYGISSFILLAGVVQLLAPLPALKKMGFRYLLSWNQSKEKVKLIVLAMLPVVVGLSVTQLNTMADSLIAWFLSEASSGTSTSAFLPDLSSGTAAALYFGQRLYQFPLGVFGVALGTVLFPLLSRHAEKKDFESLKKDLLMGLRLIFIIGIPASAGLVILAEPVTKLLFERGHFDVEDTRQTSEMVAAYGCGVWAYCCLLIVHRGYYALDDRITPLRFGMLSVVLNLCLNFALMPLWKGTGLALATSFSAMIQALLVTLYLQKHVGSFDWKNLGITIMKSCIATMIMSWVCFEILEWNGNPIGTSALILVLTEAIGAAVICYFVLAKLFGLDDLWLLFPSKRKKPTR